MKADYLSYQRATTRSLLGLAIQLALGLLLLLNGLFGNDHASITAGLVILMGVPVWLILAVVYDQHRRERIEAIEAESFAASEAASSSVFDQHGEDLRVAAKRLKLMYKILVPAVSLTVGAMMIGIGIVRFRAGESALPTWTSHDVRGWSIAFGLAVAFVGFLFARYISGMAKQKVWSNLRGGAGFAVAAALLGLTMAAAQFIDILGPDVVLKYLQVAFPVVMIALGAEIFLNFVLDLYRPRKPGEFPRPAFESRVLGFVAAPDRIAESIGEAINYQFGYDVSGSWFYQLLQRTVFRVLIPVAVLVLWGMSSLAVVRPHEKGLVLRFGAFNRIIEPGLNFKWPWPIETIDVPEFTKKDPQGKVEYVSRTVTGVRTIDIGTTPPDQGKPVLWTNDHAGKEIFFLVQPGQSAVKNSDSGSTRDLSILAAEIPLHYAVSDVLTYEQLGPPELRDDLLKAVAQRAAMQYLSTLAVGDLLSSDRTTVRHELTRRVETAFAGLNPDASGTPRGSGVQILFVGLDDVHPPKETASLFEMVVGAEQKGVTAKVLDAQARAIEILVKTVGSVELADKITREIDALEDMTPSGEPTPEQDKAIAEQRVKIKGLIQNAGGRAASLILEASADRWARHMGEKTRLAEYQGQLRTYLAAPAVYRASLYFDALKTAMSNARVFIVDGKPRLWFKGDMTDRESIGEIFQAPQ
jgi:modulator of FtsH protease HflK